MKRVIITFDYEGHWGMPHDMPYDLPATTKRLLAVLERHQAKAVFFTVGKLFEEHPQTIREIHAAGHEIGLHGYVHEHLHALTPRGLEEFKANLARTNQELTKLTSHQPRGFRAPYLMGPKFYIPAVYEALAAAGYRWISNREIRYAEELFRPDRLKWGRGVLQLGLLRQLAQTVLNLGLIRNDQLSGQHTRFATWRWLIRRPQPFTRPEGLIEYPLYSPLDCDLVGLPKPNSNNDPHFINYATRVLIERYERSDDYFNLNLHDWIIGTGNRLAILDAVLAHIAADPAAGFWLPGTNDEAAS